MRTEVAGAEKKRRRGKWYDLYLYDGMMEVRNAESVAIMRWNMSCPRETAEKLLVERTWVAGRVASSLRDCGLGEQREHRETDEWQFGSHAYGRRRGATRRVP